MTENRALITWWDVLVTWSRIAALSFGGPAGQIAVMHRIIVEEKKWIDEDQFFRALNFCMFLPGPEAQQLATYIGILTKGIRGGLLAGIIFIFPGFVTILGLSLLYVSSQGNSLFSAMLYGLKPAVVIVVVESLFRISRRVLKSRVMVAVSIMSFVAIHIFKVPYPWIVLAAGGIGGFGSRIHHFWSESQEKVGTAQTPDSVSLNLLNEPGQLVRSYIPGPTICWTGKITLLALPIWFGPLLVVGLILGTESTIFQQGLFFGKSAVVTFGGAYAILTYVAQQAVDRYQWVTASQMMDGLGMAETTPGPLIMVVQFVAFMGAYQNPGSWSPILAALTASLLTTWVTFVPSFYFVFLGAPFVERLRENRVLSGGLVFLTAAAVGSVANIAIWFSIQVLFLKTETCSFGWINLALPNIHTPDVTSWVVICVASWLRFRQQKSMMSVITVCLILSGILGLAKH